MEAIVNFLTSTGFYQFFQGDNWKSAIMLVIACVLLFLGIVKKFEPLLLVPIAFGMLVTNLPGADMFHEILFAGGHVHWDLFGGEPITAQFLSEMLSSGVSADVLQPYADAVMTSAQNLFSADVINDLMAQVAANGSDAVGTLANQLTALASAEQYAANYGVILSDVTVSVGLIDVLYLGIKLGIYPCLIFMGVGAICIKDMANLLLPMEAYSLVKALKETVSVPIHLHTHNTSGTGDMTLLMAAYAGVDIVDTALSPMANGTSQPATESLVATLQGTVRDTGLSLEKMSPVAAHFRKVAQRLQDAGILDPKVLRVDTNTLLYQVPGGMLSNLISQLKQAGKEDKYYDVLAEIPRVRKDFGYPPLVTPSSQIVGTQAVMNVIMGERYKTFPKESRAMLKGEYGKLPGEVNEEVRAKAGIAPEDVITCRPADLLEPELDKYRQEFKGLAKSDEDVLSLALFPQVAPKFIEKRDAPKAAPAPAAPAAKPADANGVRELYVEWKN